MKSTRALGIATLTAGVTAAGLFGGGMGTAAADPGPNCGGRSATVCRPEAGPTGRAPQSDWQRGTEEARRDHQPFEFNGRHVTPMPAGNGAGWGFWFLGRWIAL